LIGRFAPATPPLPLPPASDELEVVDGKTGAGSHELLPPFRRGSFSGRERDPKATREGRQNRGRCKKMLKVTERTQGFIANKALISSSSKKRTQNELGFEAKKRKPKPKEAKRQGVAALPTPPHIPCRAGGRFQGGNETRKRPAKDSETGEDAKRC